MIQKAPASVCNSHRTQLAASVVSCLRLPQPIHTVSDMGILHASFNSTHTMYPPYLTTSMQPMQAYKATDTTNWLVNKANWCCQNTGFGCPAPIKPPALLTRPIHVPTPHAQCKDATLPVDHNCAVVPSQVISVVSALLGGFTGLPSRWSCWCCLSLVRVWGCTLCCGHTWLCRQTS